MAGNIVFAQNVGIGTNAPDARLHISYNSGVLPSLLIQESDNDFGRLRFTNNNSTSASRYWDIGGYIGSSATDDRLNIYNPSSGNVMSITGSGTVHVGAEDVGGTHGRLNVNHTGTGAHPQLRLRQAGGDGWARLLFANSNGNAFTIGGNKSVDTAPDALTFFSERLGRDLLILSSNESNNIKLNGSVTLRMPDIPFNNALDFGFGSAGPVTVNDYDIGNNSALRVEAFIETFIGTGDELTGLSGGVSGRILFISYQNSLYPNAAGVSRRLYLKGNDSRSLAGNRFLFNDILLEQGDSVILMYQDGRFLDGWVCIGRYDN